MCAHPDYAWWAGFDLANRIAVGATPSPKATRKVACVPFGSDGHTNAHRKGYHVGIRRLGEAIAVLREEINAALKEAMKAHDKRRTSTLRLVNAALKDRDIEARGAGKAALGDDEILGVLQKMIKQRQESLDIYSKAGRSDLATQEREEIEIIASYLPKQMSEEETRVAVEAVVKDTGAASMKDMGRVMAALKERYSGRIDLAKAGGTVKAVLGR